MKQTLNYTIKMNYIYPSVCTQYIDFIIDIDSTKNYDDEFYDMMCAYARSAQVQSYSAICQITAHRGTYHGDNHRFLNVSIRQARYIKTLKKTLYEFAKSLSIKKPHIKIKWYLCV